MSASAGTKQREVVVGGVRSPVRQSGPSDAGEAVLFLHGNPGSSEDWAELVEATGELGRAIAFDLPGFGKADKPRDFEHTTEGYARFVDEALAQLGVERVHLVLHDFGGPIGLEWAAAHPDRLASIVLINTGVLIGYRWHVLARIWRTPVVGEVFQGTATRGAFRLLLRRGNRRPLPRAFIDRMYDDFDRGTRNAVLKLYRATSDPDADARRVSAVLRPHDRPALVVWGKNDPYIGVEIAARQREAFPRADVEILEDSGHFPFADDPERVRSLVVPFLRRQLSGA